MKKEWLFPGAVVPVDVETTAALVAEIKRLIDIVGGLILKQGPDYERGFVDGMQKQMQSSVDKAVNALAQPEQLQLPEPRLTGKFSITAGKFKCTGCTGTWTDREDAKHHSCKDYQ